MVFTMFLVLV